MKRACSAICGLAGLLLAASPAVAQEADPIGALLDSARPGPTSAPQQAPPLPYVYVQPTYSPPAYVPPVYVPPVYTPPPRRPQLTAPVHIDEIGKTPEAPLSITDLNYEARLMASFNSAQGMQGPLDGAWSLSGAEGALYELQMVDTGSGGLEGAWRDPRRRGAVDASGFIDSISRVGGQMTLRITPRFGAEPTLILLSAAPDGTWTGELNERGQHRAVTLKRN